MLTSPSKIARGWLMSVEARDRLNELASRCKGDDVIVIRESGGSDVRAFAEAVGMVVPPPGHSDTGRGSAAVIADFLRCAKGVDFGKLADALEDAAKRAPVGAVAIVHAKDDFIKILFWPRPHGAAETRGLA
jgi:hypothetical protein